MALKSIAEEWEGFARMIFTDGPPSKVQEAEMRKAFFAGAWVIVTAMEEIGEPHISEEPGVAYIEARHGECKDFKTRLMADDPRDDWPPPCTHGISGPCGECAAERRR